MKTKAEATQKYIVDLWSAKHYKSKCNARTNIFEGIITDVKTKEQFFFSNVVGFLTAIDELYRKSEGRKASNKWKSRIKMKDK